MASLSISLTLNVYSYNFSSFYWQIQSIVRTLYQVLEEDALELKTEINHKNGNIH